MSTDTVPGVLIIEEPEQNTNGVFTAKEEELLELTLDTRIAIIKGMCKDGVPLDGKSVRVLNEVMNGADSSVNQTASTRLKKDEIKNNDSIKETALQVLLNISRSKKQNTPIERNLDKASDYIPDDIVAGETTDGYEELDLNLFIGGAK